MSNADDDPKRAARARAAEERKETEDLLAGFDRPGRTPRTPAVRRDFVDYFNSDRADVSARRESANARPGATEDRRRAVETFVVPREKSPPAWIAWALLLVAMPVAGGLIAYCAASPDSPSTARLPRLPRTATTISAATSSAMAPSNQARPTTLPTPTVPPSAAPAAALDDTAPAASSRPRPVAPAPLPAPSDSVDPRVDFIRNL